MKVAALVHFALSFRSAGSEVVVHELLRAAAAAGHDVTMWCTHKDSQRNWTGNEPDTELDGVKIKRVRNVLIGQRALRVYKPDVVVTHHDHSVFAIKTAQMVGARSVLLTHNDMDINKRPLAAGPDLVIHNSEWVAESLLRFGEPKQSMVFHPPLTPDRHKVDKTGDAITLVNMNSHKGADLFYGLAARMPERSFLGVEGGHGVQVIRRNLPNVTIARHDPNMKPVWESTHILLMPSVYESYGLVAVEAGLNGIPTIANATPGLLENIGEGGPIVDWGARNLPNPYRGNEKHWHAEWANPSEGHLNEWVEAIAKADSNYQQASDYARDRADDAMKKTRDTLRRWVDWIG